VKAKAPNAPIGAARMKIATSLNTACPRLSSTFRAGAPRSPTIARAMPNGIEKNSTCRMLPSANAPTTEAGMMSIRKPTGVRSCALAVNSLTLVGSRLAGSMCMPAPGCTRLATVRPRIRAKVETTKK
jgi:hypothetical protein